MTRLRGGHVFLIVALLCSATALLLMRASVTVCPGPKSWIDSLKLREIVAHPASTRELPMKDGAFDPYELLRKGIVERDCFQSDRSETGPTDAEIARGDYTNFPWERYRGDGKLDGPPVPLLVAKVRDYDGDIVVGLSDGTITCSDVVPER